MSDHDKLAIGTALGGRYKLTEEIGEGGFGKIYRARQLNVDRDVAVKLLPPRCTDLENVVERFRREARLASRLRHPHTITIHDYGRHDGLFYIAMEYLEGQDLADLLARESTLGLRQARHIALQTLESLREAHEFGIVHRDLKPENIFLTSVGDDTRFVKVLDFGIAKFAGSPEHQVNTRDEDGRSLTIQGSTVGTPIYMSPEQAAADSISAASDLYTVGLILFEMLNGHPPFAEERPAQTMRAHLFDPVPAFSNDNLRNTEAEALVRKALSKEPQDRFDSAGDFVDALSSMSVDASESEGPRDDTAHLSETAADESAPADNIPFDSVNSGPQADSSEPDLSISNSRGPGGSSIITVVDEPDDEDVFVLTEDCKKTANSGDASSDTSPRTPGDHSTDDDWSWSGPGNVNGADTSGSQILNDIDSGPDPQRLVVVTSLVIATLIVFFVYAVNAGWIPVN